jgi:hypothetical protein
MMSHTDLYIFDRPIYVYNFAGCKFKVYGILVGIGELQDTFPTMRLNVRTELYRSEWKNQESIFTNCWERLNCHPNTHEFLSADHQIYHPFIGNQPVEFERDFDNEINYDNRCKVALASIISVLKFDTDFIICQDNLFLSNVKTYKNIQETMVKNDGIKWLSLN